MEGVNVERFLTAFTSSTRTPFETEVASRFLSQPTAQSGFEAARHTIASITPLRHETAAGVAKQIAGMVCLLVLSCQREWQEVCLDTFVAPFSDREAEVHYTYDAYCPQAVLLGLLQALSEQGSGNTYLLIAGPYRELFPSRLQQIIKTQIRAHTENMTPSASSLANSQTARELIREIGQSTRRFADNYGKSSRERDDMLTKLRRDLRERSEETNRKVREVVLPNCYRRPMWSPIAAEVIRSLVLSHVLLNTQTDDLLLLGLPQQEQTAS